MCMASRMAFTACKLISAACMQTGTDQFSDQLAQQLLASGCQLDLLKQVEGPTGSAVIMLQPNGMHLSLPVHVSADIWIKYCVCILHRAAVAEFCTLALVGSCAGENSIIIVGGANTAEWHFDNDQQQVRGMCLCDVDTCL